MPEPEAMDPPSPTTEPAPAPSTQDVEALLADLSAARARVRDAGARIASEAQALERGGEEVAQVLEVLGEVAASGGDRLDAGQEQGEEALDRWADALEAAGSALGETQRLQQEAGAAFESEVAEARRGLEERLSELVGSFQMLEEALEGLTADVDALDDGLDESVSRLEQVLTATGEAADAIAQEIESKTGQVTGVVADELSPIIGQGFEGLVAEVEAQLAPSANPLGTVEKEAVALLTAATEELSGLGDEAIDAAEQVVEDVAPEWETPFSSVTAAADETVDRQGVQLFEELDRLMGTLHSGVDITAAWKPVLAQLPPLPEMAERINEMLESMGAD